MVVVFVVAVVVRVRSCVDVQFVFMFTFMLILLLLYGCGHFVRILGKGVGGQNFTLAGVCYFLSQNFGWFGRERVSKALVPNTTPCVGRRVESLVRH